MARLRQLLSGGVASVIIIASAGCSGEEDRQARDELRLIGIEYHRLSDFREPPTGPEDMARRAELPKWALEVLQSGRYVIIWSVLIDARTAGFHETVLGYQKNPDSKGNRLVLMADATVVTMTEKEFQAAPKAKAQAP